LNQAIQCYYDVYKTDPKSYLWHGINSVALLERARRDQVALEGFPPAIDIAKKIESLLSDIGDPASWDRATAVENAVALGRNKEAYDNALYYLADPQVDAFECASLLRQLSEVWQLKESEEPGSTLIPTLKAYLLQKQGGQLDVARQNVSSDAEGAKVANDKLEKVFGSDRYQPLAWYRTGLNRCEAVARIESVNGTRVGTAFLVKASDFFPGRDMKGLLLLTNAHVISPLNPPFPGSVAPEAAKAVFEANNLTCAVGKVVWSSPPGELDATFVTLDRLSEGSELCPLVPAADPFQPGKQQRVYVIGYPLGGGLSFSLQDSIWLDTSDSRLHYRTPTEPGSSGSPVFDEQYWTLIGLHHAGDPNMPRLHGGGTYPANEGIAISAILNATKALT
jgi:S1-C subfamily serine protease